MNLGIDEEVDIIRQIVHDWIMNDKSFIKHVEFLRKKYGSYQSVADKLGISERQLQRLRSGVCKVSKATRYLLESLISQERL